MTKDEAKVLRREIGFLCFKVQEISYQIDSSATYLRERYNVTDCIHLNKELAWIKQDISNLQTAIRTLEDEIKDKMETPTKFSIQYLLENEVNEE